MSDTIYSLLSRMHATLSTLCPAPLSPEGMHGALSAIIISPNTLLPNAWIPVLYNMDGDQPEFHDRPQAKDFLDTAVLAHNAVSVSLNGKEEFSLPFSIDTETDTATVQKIQDWSDGFIKGLRRTGVEISDYDQDLVSLMAPIAYCARPQFFQANQDGGDDNNQLLTIAREFPANIAALQSYFILYRRRAALGPAAETRQKRNELCGCGSGKKYKHCCGK